MFQAVATNSGHIPTFAFTQLNLKNRFVFWLFDFHSALIPLRDRSLELVTRIVKGHFCASDEFFSQSFLVQKVRLCACYS